jgi:large subunit ribosomal protein L31
MAKSTEITYYSDATATCSNCNSVYTLGMTVEKITVEICGNCHPFYTGQETLIDTAGRIEKFEARAQQSQAGIAKKSKFKTRKARQSLADLSVDQETEVAKEKPAKPKKVAAKKESQNTDEQA